MTGTWSFTANSILCPPELHDYGRRNILDQFDQSAQYTSYKVVLFGFESWLTELWQSYALTSHFVFVVDLVDLVDLVVLMGKEASAAENVVTKLIVHIKTSIVTASYLTNSHRCAHGGDFCRVLYEGQQEMVKVKFSNCLMFCNVTLIQSFPLRMHWQLRSFQSINCLVSVGFSVFLPSKGGCYVLHRMLRPFIIIIYHL